MSKTKYIIPLFAFTVIRLMAQTTNQNYVKQTTYLNPNASDFCLQVQYYDGLGRPTQKVVGGCNTDGRYLHFQQDHDLSGRIIKSWAPVIGTSTPDFISNINSASSNVYKDPMAFEAIEYDCFERAISISTPGSKWKENDKKKQINYRSNNIEEVRIFTTSDLEGSKWYQKCTLNCTEEYNEDGILVTTFKDALDRIVLVRQGNENNDTYYVYNEQGLLAYVLPPMYHLKSNDDTQTKLDKYAFQYTYDMRGLTVSKKLPGCQPIRYWYNRARRLVCMQDGLLRESNKFRFFLYDQLGRLCIQGLTTKCYEQKQFSYIEYTYQGPQISNSGYAYFGNASEIQLKEIELELVNYYDTDSFLDAYDAMLYDDHIKFSLQSPNKYSYLLGTKQHASNGEELLTTFAYDDYGRVCRKGEIGLNKQLTITNYSYNFVGDVTSETTEVLEYNKQGEIYETKFKATLTNNYDAPHTNLLTSSLLTVWDDYSGNTMTDTIQKLTYDDFGHIIGNNRSGTAGDMSYAYDNLHGWTTQIMSAGGFVQNLYRETEGATPRWDGSISATTWQTEDDMEHRYDYTYDGLNRLTKADYTSRFSLQQRVVTDLTIIDTVIGTIDGIKNAVSPRFSLNKLQALIPESENSNLTIEQTEESAETSVHTGFDSGTIEEPPLTKVSPDNYTKQNGDYSELVEYDANTNITSLLRYGMKNNKQYGLIDDLSIHHNGNQITSVSDAVDENLNYEGAFDFVDGENKDKEYAYDGNGALTMDLNKRIQSIEYDLLGNPRKITMTYGKSIEYIYASDGRKLRTIHYQKIKNPNYSSLTMREPKYIEIKDSTDYIGNLRLSDGKANMYLFQGGYYSFDGNMKPECHYYVQDYQGNNRMVVNKDNTIEQTTHYYPYGGVIGDISTGQNLQKYKYGNKELDRTYGLDLYDFEARQYDAITPWFTSIDPLAEKYYSISPYVYCAGDPVNLVDRDGCEFDYTALNEEQRKIYFSCVETMRKASESFDKLYSIMESSTQIISIKFGQTITDGNGETLVPAQYSSGENNTGTIIINEDVQTLKGAAIGEEIFHAFQQDNKGNYGGTCNKEFEAKTFTTIVGQESDSGMQRIGGMESFQSNIQNDKYTTDSSLTPVSLTQKFLQDYKVHANTYSSFNTRFNIGNANYKVKTNVDPYCLMKILK